jgi:hypothetical protein
VPGAPPPAAALERLHLAAGDLAACWRQGEGLLALAAPAPVAAGARVAVRLTGAGEPVELGGTARTVTPARGTYAVEVAVDGDGQALLARIEAALRGAGPLPRPRARRWRVMLPAVVIGPHGAAYMTAYSLSEGGCGLAWSGPLPRLGAGLMVRLGTGPRAVSVRGMTCWVREAPKGPRVGVRFLGATGGAVGLPALLAEARRDGAEA